MSRFGTLLLAARGDQTRAAFARRLELSYTFVRALEDGVRSPSDGAVRGIADRLSLDAEELLLAAHCDRSPALERVLVTRGVVVELTGPPARRRLTAVP